MRRKVSISRREKTKIRVTYSERASSRPHRRSHRDRDITDRPEVKGGVAREWPLHCWNITPVNEETGSKDRLHAIPCCAASSLIETCRVW